MRFVLNVGDAKSSTVRRRTQKPRRDVSVNMFSQVQTGNANDTLIAEARCFVFHSLVYGKPEQLFKKRSGVFCSTKTQDTRVLCARDIKMCTGICLGEVHTINLKQHSTVQAPYEKKKKKNKKKKKKKSNLNLIMSPPLPEFKTCGRLLWCPTGINSWSCPLRSLLCTFCSLIETHSVSSQNVMTHSHISSVLLIRYTPMS